MLDQRLIKSINSGRCFLLVGSGASCDVGYPTWENLATKTFKRLKQTENVSNEKDYQKYIAERKFPEMFRLAEGDLGSRDQLIEIVKSLLTKNPQKQGELYNLLTRWPFACFLTTNYDDEIQRHLEFQKIPQSFQVIGNTKEEFSVYREGVAHVIQKLHGDFDANKNGLVLTSADYQEYYTGNDKKYFRDKLRQVLEMFDILIVGHSLTDPDIEYILRVAKETSSPSHPIFFIGADFTKAEENEFFEKYNIVLISYDNNDGKHEGLKRLMKLLDRFILSRGEQTIKKEDLTLDKEETRAAMGLLLHRRLQGVKEDDFLPALVLSSLNQTKDNCFTVDDLMSQPAFKIFPQNDELRDLLYSAVQQLKYAGFAELRDGKISLAEKGLERVKETEYTRKTERENALSAFKNDLSGSDSNFTREQLNQCANAAESLLVKCFESRGTTVANQVYSGQTPQGSELTDIFGLVTKTASGFSDRNLQIGFVEAMHRFLVEPNDQQKQYLSSLSQGYFLYHLLGLDPSCSRVKRDVFEKTLWILDSSVILPAIAVGCYGHEFSSKLFKELKCRNACVIFTGQLLREAWEHLEWAKQFVKRTEPGSPEFLRAALAKGSYKQNLFIDGYIRLAADGKVSTFGDYLKHAFQEGTSMESFYNRVQEFGRIVREISDLEGFEETDREEVERTKKQLEEKRRSHGTFRSPLQVNAEAEVSMLIKGLRSGKYVIPRGSVVLDRYYFVSQSKMIDIASEDEGLKTWSTEALYRYISSLPDRDINPDLLQKCMTQEYFYAGLTFIDKEKYQRYFGPSIDAAKASFQEEKKRYVEAVEERFSGEIEKGFEETSDLEKPFYVAQMGWKTANLERQRAEIAGDRAANAEARVKELEREREKGWKLKEERRRQHEEGRIRNLQDPKKIRKKERQRNRRRKRK